MTFFLKILNEVRSRRYLKCDGNSGKIYVFEWDAKIRAYTYHPKTQDEVDDLYRTMGRTTSYVFAPVSLPADPVPQVKPAETPKAQPATEEPEAPKSVPPDQKLVEQALHRRVIVTDDDSDETIRRLIAAYDKGSMDALETLPARRAKQKREPAG